MLRLALILTLFFTTHIYADDRDVCKWRNDIPCVTIYPKYTNNYNALGDKISPTKIIKKSEIDKYNLIDLPKVLLSLIHI